MQYFLDTFGTPALLVHVASALYVVGFLVRDQLKLRVLVLVATVLYIAYYYFAPAVPLWEAIAWSLVLGAANLWVTIQILQDRTTFAMSEPERRLYDELGTLSPGEFRSLMQIATWRELEAMELLTRHGEPVDDLTYLFDGRATVRKDGKSHELEGRTFIGEIAFLLQRGASADVEAAAGARIVQWRANELNDLCRRKPALRLGLDRVLNRDMAQKVARS